MQVAWKCIMAHEEFRSKNRYSDDSDWLDFTLIYTVPFWPVIVIVMGFWMVYRGFMTKGMVCSKNHKEV